MYIYTENRPLGKKFLKCMHGYLPFYILNKTHEWFLYKTINGNLTPFFITDKPTM